MKKKLNLISRWVKKKKKLSKDKSKGNENVLEDNEKALEQEKKVLEQEDNKQNKNKKIKKKSKVIKKKSKLIKKKSKNKKEKSGLKRKSIKFKIMGIIAFVMLVIFVIIALVASLNVNKIVREKINKESRNLSYTYGTVIDATMEKSLDTAEALAGAVNGLVKYGNVNRNQIDVVQKQVLKESDEATGIWVVAEENAFDGKDSAFAGKKGQIKSGRYASFFVRDGSEIIKQNIGNEYTPGGFFKEVRSTKNPLIFDPYLDKVDGQEVLVTSLVYPIFQGQKFLGVVGIDIKLDSFQYSVKDFLKKNSGLGISLISYNGTYVANSDSKLLGKEMVKKDQKIIDTIHKGKELETNVYSEHLKCDVNRLYTPIKIGGIDTPWSLVVDIPVSRITNEVNKVTIGIVIISVISLIIILGFLYIILNNFMNNLSMAVKHIKYIETGDFTREVPKKLLKRQDEFGVLGQSIHKMQDEIKQILGKIKISFDKVDTSYGVITEMTDQLNNIIGEVSKNLDEITSSVVDEASDLGTISQKANSLDDKINKSSEIIFNVVNISLDTSKLSKDGMEIMKLLDAKTCESNNKTTEIQKVIQDTNESANNAERIIGLIDSVADQTNLLALNASIEAARAGEAGRGFAVVAEEIRKLSEQTSNATNDIKHILSSIQNKSNEAESTMNEFTGIIDEQNKTIKDTNGIFKNTSELLNNLTLKIEKVKEHTLGIDNNKKDMITALNSVAEVSEKTAANTEEITSAIEEQVSGIDEINSYTKKTRELIEDLKIEIDKFNI